MRLPRDRPVPTDADGTNNEFKPINPRYIGTEGEKALERALGIVQSNPDVPRVTMAETLLQLGDWHQIKHQPDKALSYYQQAATVTDAMTASEAVPVAPLGFPVRVYYPIPSLATRNISLPPEQVDEQYVQVEFTVTGEGSVIGAKVTDQSGTSRQASEALQAIRSARFRPKFVSGKPVETSGVTYRQVFRTRKADSSDS
jgi:TonB family protein